MIGKMTKESMLDGIALGAFSAGETMSGLFESRYQSMPNDPRVYLFVLETAVALRVLCTRTTCRTR